MTADPAEPQDDPKGSEPMLQQPRDEKNERYPDVEGLVSEAKLQADVWRQMRGSEARETMFNAAEARRWDRFATAIAALQAREAALRKERDDLSENAATWIARFEESDARVEALEKGLEKIARMGLGSFGNRPDEYAAQLLKDNPNPENDR